MTDYFVPHREMKFFLGATRCSDRLELTFLLHVFDPEKTLQQLTLRCIEAGKNDLGGLGGMKQRRADFDFDAPELEIKFFHVGPSQDVLDRCVLKVTSVTQTLLEVPADGALVSVLGEFHELLASSVRQTERWRETWDGLRTRVAKDKESVDRRLEHFKDNAEKAAVLRAEQAAFARVIELMNRR